MIEKEYKSTKSRSRFIARGDKKRAYLVCEGEASTNAVVIRNIERIRKEGSDFATVDWIARQLIRSY